MSANKQNPQDEAASTTTKVLTPRLSTRPRARIAMVLGAVSFALVVLVGLVLLTVWQLRPEEERLTLTTAPAPNSYVSQKEFGAAWPLTIKQGYLNCREGQILTLVVPSGFFRPATVYTLNQTAADYAKWSGYSWKPLAGSALVLIDKDTGQSRSLTPLLERGTDVCWQRQR